MLYDLAPEVTTASYYENDKMAEAKKKYQGAGGERSNMVYGFLHK